MYINIEKTLVSIGRDLLKEKGPNIAELKRAYAQTIRLQSQLLSLIYDAEAFGRSVQEKSFALEMTRGTNGGAEVILTIQELLPSMKRLTEAIEEHWKAMIHGAIEQAARQGPLPYFKKAFVGLEIVTPRGSGNARLWDTSNRAINVVINNLKGIFFEDDNMEHMAFSVVGKWGEQGVTTIRITELGHALGGYSGTGEPENHEL